MNVALPQPGAIARIRSTNWKVLGIQTAEKGYKVLRCRGLSGITKDKEAHFIWNIEEGAQVLDPAGVELCVDQSSGLIDTKLYLEAAFRNTPTTSRSPLTLGRAAIDDLKFQHLPVERALRQDRVRLLIADDVGLGKVREEARGGAGSFVGAGRPPTGQPDDTDNPATRSRRGMGSACFKLIMFPRSGRDRRKT